MSSGIRILYQAGIFQRDHFILIPIEAPYWMHEILLHTCHDRQSTYQIAEEDTTMVGYEFLQFLHVQQMIAYIRMEEQRRFDQLLLTEGRDEQN